MCFSVSFRRIILFTCLTFEVWGGLGPLDMPSLDFDVSFWPCDVYIWILDDQFDKWNLYILHNFQRTLTLTVIRNSSARQVIKKVSPHRDVEMSGRISCTRPLHGLPPVSILSVDLLDNGWSWSTSCLLRICERNCTISMSTDGLPYCTRPGGGHISQGGHAYTFDYPTAVCDGSNHSVSFISLWQLLWVFSASFSKVSSAMIM